MILQQVGVPIYLQVKTYIMEKIASGEYRPGDKLPTERQLAGELAISRNTVSAAYKELLDDGVLEARQGRGTFVRAQEDDGDEMGEITGSRRERALRIIDQAMAKVVELGFTVEQFAAIATIRAKEKAEAVRELRVAVVDCTAEYIRHFIGQMGQIAHVQFEGVTLAELEQGKVPPGLLTACDIVITTLLHQGEVSKYLSGQSGKLLTVAVVPNLKAIIRMARLEPGTTVGIVAETQEFVQAFRQVLLQTSIAGVEFDVSHDADKEALRQFVQRHSVLIVSDEREQQVRQLADIGRDVITFYYEIDQGSLQQIRSRLLAETANSSFGRL